MVRKKLIKMFSILGIAVTLFFGYSFYNNLNKEEVPQTISIENCKNVIEEEDSIVEEVKSIGRIEIMQCQIGKKINISNDALLKCFNKKSIIDYKVCAHYYLDLQESDVFIKNNVLTIYAKKPTIETNILYNLTKINSDNGMLSFGDLKLTPEEQLNIENKMCDSVKKECEEEINNSIKYAEKSVKQLVDKINQNVDVVNIKYMI